MFFKRDSIILRDLAVCAYFGVWWRGRDEAFRRGGGLLSSGGRVRPYGGSTPRAVPALCHIIPDPQPLTPPCRSHRWHARAVQSVDSGTLDFALMLAGRRTVIAQLAGRFGSAGAAAAWPPLRAGWTYKRLPTWRRPVSLSHWSARSTQGTAPSYWSRWYGRPEAYGRRAVEVRFLHGPPLWDVATLSLTLTLTLTL